MAKAILICGKICSGKSTYAEKLRLDKRSVLLSCDEITLALFGQDAGDKHDEYVEKLQSYLLNKSLEVLEVGVDVILDWGFWQKEERKLARAFYKENGAECEFHYINIDDKLWAARLQKRNSAVLNKEVSAYYDDEGLAKKFGGIFEEPRKDEIDVWIKAEDDDDRA